MHSNRSWHMAEAARKAWTVEEFFDWQEKQDDRYELVDGLPLRMMAGASAAHVQVSVNVLGQLYIQLRGTGCRPFHGDGSVQTKPGQIRRPDIGVDCSPLIPGSYTSSGPRMVGEVLSPTTRTFDMLRKIEEYKRMTGLQRILLIEPNKPEVAIWARSDAGEWQYSLAEGLAADLAMPEIGVVLKMADIYEGITLPADLQVVAGE